MVSARDTHVGKSAEERAAYANSVRGQPAGPTVDILPAIDSTTQPTSEEKKPKPTRRKKKSNVDKAFEFFKQHVFETIVTTIAGGVILTIAWLTIFVIGLNREVGVVNEQAQAVRRDTEKTEKSIEDAEIRAEKRLDRIESKLTTIEARVDAMIGRAAEQARPGLQVPSVSSGH
jgi:nitrogenase molybdenum-iron protein alpha/beta subunit